jgi:hypothetical protein
MARTSFLFWNTNRKQVQAHVAALAFHHDIDVLILGECEIEHAVLAGALNASLSGIFQAVECQSTFVRLYSRLPFLTPLEDRHRLAAWRLGLPGCDELLLVAVHLVNRRDFSDHSKQQECTALAENIRDLESLVGHSRTVLVGDFNLNPFEPGMIGTGGLHAVMSRVLALEGKRTVQDQEYSYFYNPMWGRFGDGSPGPCGTYYYRKAEPVCYFWNMFDQVLLRPALLNHFDVNQLKVPIATGAAALVNADGQPDSDEASDHLPIIFELDL